MPKDVSSSSEDEAENPAPETAEPPPKQPGKALRFDCPSDFVSFCHMACSGAAADALRDDQKELWLIKAPVSFDPRRFSGIKVPLSGLRTVKVPGSAGPDGGHQIYSVLASRRSAAELRLLTCDPQDRLALAPPFSGQLNICESYGDSSTNQSPQVIPASPAPAVPPGLRQRFLPFGSRTPTVTSVGEDEVEGTQRLLVATEGRGSADEEEEEEGRRKKKKKIKKRIKEEEVEIKQEPVDEMIPVSLQEDEPPEKRKKKKKKREREEMEVKEEPLSVKQEPPDAWFDAAPSSGKKKKKKKQMTALL